MKEVHDPTGDFDLVERFKRGDQSAFDELTKRHYQRVCNILFHTLGASPNIEDLAQEVFIKAYYSLRRYRGESALSTWLYRITVNVALDEMRRQKRRRIFSFTRTGERGLTENEIAGSVAGGEGSEVAAERAEFYEIVQRALKRIPVKHQMVFVLREIEGYSYSEIAEVVSCSVGTVKSRLFHARLKLRRYLQPYLREKTPDGKRSARGQRA
jgi:RNA polymerase sigma-70 factor (ECF subfamily)